MGRAETDAAPTGLAGFHSDQRGVGNGDGLAGAKTVTATASNAGRLIQVDGEAFLDGVPRSGGFRKTVQKVRQQR